MRKLAPVMVGLVVAVAGSLVQPAAAMGSGHGPGWPGPRAAAQSSPVLITSPVQRPAVASAVNCDSTFHSVASPNGANNDLFATAAVSANDVWAVGVTNLTSSFVEQPLAEHWNGTSWTIVPTPSPTTV